MNNRDKKNIMIIALLVAVIFMSAGYAVLSSQINISGTATIVDPVWDVKISSISSTETSGYGKNINATIENKFSAKFNAEFMMPGDKVTYVINIKNEGTLDAKLNSIKIEPETSNNDSIIYTLDGIEANDVLLAGDSKMFTLTSEYSISSDNILTQDNISKEITLILDYIQN